MDKDTVQQPQQISTTPTRIYKDNQQPQPIDYILTDKQKAELRKAYYSQQLNTFVDKEAAKGGVTPEYTNAIYSYLEGLEKERAQLHQEITTYDIAKKIALPQVQELMRLPEGKKQAIEAWEAQTEVKYQEARQIFAKAQNSDIRGNMDTYLNYGFQLAELQYDLDVYRVWKDQLYRAKIVQFIDTYGISRAEAEERAKLTAEYRNYKKAVLFRELTEEFIKLCKKKYGMHS